jgi:hypothetical protein
MPLPGYIENTHAHKFHMFPLVPHVTHRKSLDADGEWHDENVPPGAEPGHGKRNEDQNEEPYKHPQRVCAA